MKHPFKRAAALLLTLSFLLAPTAQALTVDQLKDLLQEHYIDQVPQAALEADTIEGVIAALNDPYTVYMSAQEFEDYMALDNDKTMVGIGISASEDSQGLLIMGVYEDSPAQKLGLTAGDRIIQVEGQDAAGQSAEVITGWLKGEAGTTVNFVVRHADGKTQNCTTQRAEIVVPIATTKLLEDGSTALITCDAFSQDALDHVSEGVMAYDDANLWLVDLRSNGGGDVYAVTQMLGLFLGEGDMLYMRQNDGNYYRFTSSQKSETIYPAIVLTSVYSASASEIFAMGIKDQNGGLLIGSTTFGKGVAQAILTGEEEPEALVDGEALKVTISKFYGTGGNTPQNIGVIPDLLVDPNHADEIAQLFSAQAPTGDTSGWLCLHLGGWRWYVDTKKAMTAENQPYFAELLSALPPSAPTFQGTGDSWSAATAAQIAKDTGVAGYESRSFTDVAGLSCEKAANTLRTYEIILGYEDGTFRPNGTLTRAELCALLCQATGLRLPSERVAFSDVGEEDWFDDYIQAAVAAGYMDGVGNGRFYPEGTVTQEQLITVLGRVSASLNMNFYEAAQQVPSQTGVPGSFSSWSEPWVWLLAKSQRNLMGTTLNMLHTDLASISPKAPATRGETAQTLYNIFFAVSILNY
ncbi:MAG: PDZ domain-containing protein [Ruminiclostridium sp.]|jgi:carboxyl-terminal processing protease|nr:PDZ domain-containing protein [Ruminiclostridium sp.]